MRLTTACLLLLSATNNKPSVLVNGFQFNPLQHISRGTNTQNVGTPQISSLTPQTTTIITSSNTITTSTSLAAKRDDDESPNGFGKKKGRPKPPPRRSPTKDIKQAMEDNMVRMLLFYIVFMRCLMCLCGVSFGVGVLGVWLAQRLIY